MVLSPKDVGSQRSCCLESTPWLISVNVTETWQQPSHIASEQICSQAIRCQRVGSSLGSAPCERMQLPCMLAVHHALVAALFMPHF